MFETFRAVIARGSYDLTGLLRNIDRYHIEGRLSEDERESLYNLARQEPKPQYDCAVEIEKLWAAVRALQKRFDADSGDEEEYPYFVQPSGAHDAYNAGDNVTYGDKRYVCMMDNCVWSPDVLPSAWQLVET